MDLSKLLTFSEELLGRSIDFNNFSDIVQSSCLILNKIFPKSIPERVLKRNPTTQIQFLNRVCSNLGIPSENFLPAQIQEDIQSKFLNLVSQFYKIADQKGIDIGHESKAKIDDKLHKKAQRTIPSVFNHAEVIDQIETIKEFQFENEENQENTDSNWKKKDEEIENQMENFSQLKMVFGESKEMKPKQNREKYFITSFKRSFEEIVEIVKKHFIHGKAKFGVVFIDPQTGSQAECIFEIKRRYFKFSFTGSSFEMILDYSIRTQIWEAKSTTNIIEIKGVNFDDFLHNFYIKARDQSERDIIINTFRMFNFYQKDCIESCILSTKILGKEQEIETLIGYHVEKQSANFDVKLKMLSLTKTNIPAVLKADKHQISFVFKTAKQTQIQSYDFKRYLIMLFIDPSKQTQITLKIENMQLKAERLIQMRTNSAAQSVVISGVLNHFASLSWNSLLNESEPSQQPYSQYSHKTQANVSSRTNLHNPINYGQTIFKFIQMPSINSTFADPTFISHFAQFTKNGEAKVIQDQLFSPVNDDKRLNCEMLRYYKFRSRKNQLVRKIKQFISQGKAVFNFKLQQSRTSNIQIILMANHFVIKVESQNHTKNYKMEYLPNQGIILHTNKLDRMIFKLESSDIENLALFVPNFISRDLFVNTFSIFHKMKIYPDFHLDDDDNSVQNMHFILSPEPSLSIEKRKKFLREDPSVEFPSKWKYSEINDFFQDEKNFSEELSSIKTHLIYSVWLLNSFQKIEGLCKFHLYSDHFEIVCSNFSIRRYYSSFSQFCDSDIRDLVIRFNIDENFFVYFGFPSYEARLNVILNFNKRRDNQLQFLSIHQAQNQVSTFICHLFIANQKKLCSIQLCVGGFVINSFNKDHENDENDPNHKLIFNKENGQVLFLEYSISLTLQRKPENPRILFIGLGYGKFIKLKFAEAQILEDFTIQLNDRIRSTWELFKPNSVRNAFDEPVLEKISTDSKDLGRTLISVHPQKIVIQTGEYQGTCLRIGEIRSVLLENPIFAMNLFADQSTENIGDYDYYQIHFRHLKTRLQFIDSMIFYDSKREDFKKMFANHLFRYQVKAQVVVYEDSGNPYAQGTIYISEERGSIVLSSLDEEMEEKSSGNLNKKLNHKQIVAFHKNHYIFDKHTKFYVDLKLSRFGKLEVDQVDFIVFFQSEKEMKMFNRLFVMFKRKLAKMEVGNRLLLDSKPQDSQIQARIVVSEQETLPVHLSFRKKQLVIYHYDTDNQEEIEFTKNFEISTAKRSKFHFWIHDVHFDYIFQFYNRSDYRLAFQKFQNISQFVTQTNFEVEFVTSQKRKVPGFIRLRTYYFVCLIEISQEQIKRIRIPYHLLSIRKYSSKFI
ncbi:lish domain-containing protein fopnl [Anaeramoeba ignava]|uniref:Lish domain-containing protein fopnl n=1 Tax=Anaeramoeba ignava TaxID=1746090 RepID=A0A9Q0RBG4_ANAIG|nr:lish domain-containing protein fopnl [Anaeramoeba ignava]